MIADPGKVYFIGAGPGDPGLITVKGKQLIDAAHNILYAGSLVPVELFSECPADANIRDSSGMTLEETHEFLVRAWHSGRGAVRVHTGDPSLYGAILEQIGLLAEEGVPFEIVPGVTCAFAAAAQAGVCFTSPEKNQTLIFTRAGGRTPVPESQDLERLAKSKAAMAIYLSATMAAQVEKKLLRAGLDPETKVVVGHRVGWPGETVSICRLREMAETARRMHATGQTVFLVLPGGEGGSRSSLYSPQFSHGFRK
ncbi:MAG: precorrin-4 C(11)-methyltransferase [Desulfonatronovibrionaceae bacterium]